MAVSKVRARKQKVFRSVFEPEVSQPTPLLPSSEPGEPFGGPASAPFAAHHQIPPVSDQVRWDRAWHAVTSRIQLPSSVAAEDSFGALVPESQDLDRAFANSLSLVLNPRTAVPHASQTEDLLSWHTQQVRHHFVTNVLPLLAACESQGSHEQVLFSSVRTLEAAHRQCLFGLSLVVRGMKDESRAQASVNRFRRDLHAIIGNSWTKGLLCALRHVLQRLVGTVLGLTRGVQTSSVSKARNELMGLLESLHRVGLAGERFQVLLAEIMDACMSEHIHTTYAGVWNAPDDQSSPLGGVGCMARLNDWIENCYGRLAVVIFSRLGVTIDWNDVECWKDVAVGRLATLRIQELFDIVLHWPESRGGIEDLRLAVVTPQRRLQLTDVFSATMQKRLLHPGRSTLDILQIYISMIRAFHVLDHSKVLLDRVVHALQLYLCQRDDAIRIVVTGLLSNPNNNDPEEGKKTLIELSALMDDATQKPRRHVEDDELDWDDMTWVPDPVDAGVNYKRPKNEDVVGTLISALGSQDIFIKEFQLIIAERLLSSQPNYQQEIKVLRLLKKRFGESALQNCDVMIKDIQDSKRVDSSICKAIQPVGQGDDGSPIAYHTKILSRLFWPSLPKEPFNVPGSIAALQTEYEAGFEQLKSSRKLNWLGVLGSATVQLDLEDRSLVFECKTYEAAVINAFQESDNAAEGQPVQKTFLELWEGLMIDEDLLEGALRFWVSKRVLRDVGNQTYVVLERLDDEDSNATTAAAPEAVSQESAQPSPRKPKIDAQEAERRVIYWQFIVGMLTNSGPAMPLSQIAMMMKMLIPDCPWSNEELQDFLAEKMADGELEFAGGKYRLTRR